MIMLHTITKKNLKCDERKLNGCHNIIVLRADIDFEKCINGAA